MHLGAFSVSLNVKDIEASRDFYEKLGFEPVGGNAEDNWLILRNGDHVIGLFQGMFESNILTFNPGWDQDAAALDSYTEDLVEQAIELVRDGKDDEAQLAMATIPISETSSKTKARKARRTQRLSAFFRARSTTYSIR